MNKKPMGSNSATFTVVSTDREEIGAALKHNSRRLEASEEKLLRMRYGVPADHNLELAQQGQDNPETAEILLSLEAELFRQLQEQAQNWENADSRNSSEPSNNDPNPRRDKIVQALRNRHNRS